MILGFYSAGTVFYDGEFKEWAAALKHAMPSVEVRCPPEIGDPSDIEAALVWRPPAGWLASLPNLKLIHSLGAGVDHILADPSLPRHVPIVRLVDPYMTRSMAEYMVFQVLRLHLREPEYRRQQQRREWRQLVPPVASDRRVGILGLGELGAAVAASLVALGFDVAGWSRSPKTLPGVASFSGPGEFDAFLARSEILICLLPLTAETEGILGRTTFERLPRGAGLINAGRGRHLVDDDLLAALDTGQVSEAVLDVFHAEPLAQDHPFWNHPRVVITPHVAALTNPVSAAKVVAANLKRLVAGEEFPDRIDPQAGY
jgi:glyoxylate/hydroxypyruvate reductase A